MITIRNFYPSIRDGVFSAWQTGGRFHGVIIVHLLFIFLTSALPSCGSANAFEVFIKTNYKNQPDLSKYGAKKLHMIYAQRFWSKGQDRQPLPSKERVISFVAGKYKDYPGLLILDIEHWPLLGFDERAADRVKKLITVLEWVKAAAPKAKVGYYGTIPQGVYWPLLKPPIDPSYIEWQRKNSLGQALADRVDALSPNFYAVHANQANWVKVATAKINESKRLGKGKPVYLVINPRYHSHAYDNLRYQLIPKDFFKLQLQTIKAAGARGVLIWGADNANKQWSDDLPWWQATLEFLGRK
ncbi:MAG: hypothetical protein ACREYE_33085 [Gammaproteobacteria bacterium]